MIPKNIFLIWTSEKFNSNTEVPDFCKFSAKAFKIMNPDYNVQLIDDKHEITQQFRTNVLERIKFHTPCGMFNEYLRLYVTYIYGGIYVDTDCFPVKPFDDNLLQYDFVLPYHDYFAIASKKRSLEEFLACTKFLEIKHNTHKHYVKENIGEFYLSRHISYKEYDTMRKKFYRCNLQIGEMLNDKEKHNHMYYFDHYGFMTWRCYFNRMKEYLNDKFS